MTDQPDAAKAASFKPCPFCGGRAEIDEEYQSGRTSWDCRIACAECGASGPLGIGGSAEAARADAMAVWDGRHGGKS